MPSNQTSLVLQWYKDLAASNLDGVVGIFADNASLTYGAGDSAPAITYPCQCSGKADISKFYQARFAQGASFTDTRPFCAINQNVAEWGRWVIVYGRISDRNTDGSRGYEGNFLQMWTFDPGSNKVTRCDVYFDTDASAGGAPAIMQMLELTTAPA